MKIKSSLIGTVTFGCMLASLNAIAVDGYKDLKFGMSKSEVIDSNICTLYPSDSGNPNVEYYGCTDFQFGKSNVEAGAFFIDDKFLRFIIVPSVDTAVSLVPALQKKYGAPNARSTPQEFQALDSLPNREAFIAFDNSTIFLKFVTDASYNQNAALIYTSKKYDLLLLQNQQQSVANDL